MQGSEGTIKQLKVTTQGSEEARFDNSRERGDNSRERGSEISPCLIVPSPPRSLNFVK